MRDEAIQHAIYLRRFGTGLANRMIKLLGQVDDDIISQIKRGNLHKHQRLASVLEEIRVMNRDIHKEMVKELRKELIGIAEHQAEIQAALVASHLDKTPTVISPEIIASLATDEKWQGRTLREWGYNLRDSSFNRMRDAINIGVVEGETTDQIVDRVKGLRRLRYTDGRMEMNRRATQSLVRTAVTHSTSRADEEVYKRNSKNIKGVQYSAILDSRTTPICSALDGEVFKIGEGPRPPQHFGCRSTTIPVFMDQEPFQDSFEDVLKRRPASFQDDLLGMTRGKLFREGKLPLDRFVDFNQKKFYTLEQLKTLEKAAFERVGL